jgi:hypothetical protein
MISTSFFSEDIVIALDLFLIGSFYKTVTEAFLISIVVDYSSDMV